MDPRQVGQGDGRLMGERIVLIHDRNKLIPRQHRPIHQTNPVDDATDVNNSLIDRSSG